MKEGAVVIGYVRVSTSDQADSGLGLAAQQATIVAECERRGWQLVDVISDEAASGKSLDRPGLRRALERIASGHAEGLVAAKLDRISRSVIDFATLLEWFDEAGATIVAPDLAIDTSTPSGRLVANVMSSVAQWEREVIADRTRDGLAVLRRQGHPISRPAVVDRPDVAERIRSLRAAGATYQAIADELNAAAVPTLRGGAEWRVSSVQAACGYRRPTARRQAAALPATTRRRRMQSSRSH